MSVRTSYSQNNTYVACPSYWHNQYKEKLVSEKEGASLYFGSAIDHAVTELLKNKDIDYIKAFKEKWFSVVKDTKVFQIYDNDNIIYSNSDFDDMLFTNSDFITMLNWSNELNLFGHDPVKIFKDIQYSKRNPYKNISPKQLKYFNRVSWLSLERKGEILLKSFYDQFLPKIKRVVDTQKYTRIEDGEDSITGVIDMVLEIEGYDKPVIFDLKTAAKLYEQKEIDLTQQLTLYAAMKAKEYNTDLVGYVVLCKNIPREIVNVCAKCSHIKTGRHATCDNTKADGTRCGGSWTETKTLKPQVQVLVERKTEQQMLDLMTDYANIIAAMKANIVYKNTSKCLNWYGSKCVYYDKCHNNDSSGLIKKQ